MEKIIKITCMILLGIFLINLVSAVSFSPSSLIYNLNKSQEQCKYITLGLDSPITSITNSWAENKDIDWSIKFFNTTSESHGINIYYTQENIVNGIAGKVSVCLSGTNLGEYHGIMIIKQGQVGNSIVQLGIWLKVNITDNIKNINESLCLSTQGTWSNNKCLCPSETMFKELVGCEEQEQVVGCSTNKDCQDRYTSCYSICTNNICDEIRTFAPLPDYPNCEEPKPQTNYLNYFIIGIIAFLIIISLIKLGEGG